MARANLGFENSGDADQSAWQFVPDPILVQIFSLLEVRSLLAASSTCRLWNRVGRDEIVWRNLVRTDFNVKCDVPLPSKHSSWRLEYRRLFYCTPVVETEILSDHEDQVLHVSFSHNGRYFATCSKDGCVLLWESTYPARIRHRRDMRQFSWKFTQFSQFNENDSLLLVSGVHCGSAATTGEVAIFAIDEHFSLQCRVNNSPYDVFGTWYNDNYFISGEVSRLGRIDSASHLSLVKASQEADSEYRSVMNSMLRFHNRNGSFVRNVMVADCLDCGPPQRRRDADEELAVDDDDGSNACVAGAAYVPRRSSANNCLKRRFCRTTERGNPISFKPSRNGARPTGPVYDCSRVGVASVLDGDEDSCFKYSPEYRRASTLAESQLLEIKRPRRSLDYQRSQFHPSHWASNTYYGPTVMWHDGRVEESADDVEEMNFDDEVEVESDDDDDLRSLRVLDPWDKYLIFTMGTRAGTPHQIGFKRLQPFAFMHYFDAGPTLAERMALLRVQEEARRLRRELNPDEPEDFLNSPPPLSAEDIQQRFDQPDHVIDMEGQIIGMGLSPDQRYLYVNCRPWPPGSAILDPSEPPPIAEQIDMHVIDLLTLKHVGTMLRSHRAHTSSDECFFIFLDVADRYVASGAEDKHGYFWDRHYGVCVAKLPHEDVVNSVAFNPVDPDVLVTVSDDFKVKVWRSRRRCALLGLAAAELPKGFEFRRS